MFHLAGPMKNRRSFLWIRPSSATLSVLQALTETKSRMLNEYFGKAEVVELYGMDEFAILTKEMTEGELKAAASAFDTKAQSRSEYGIKQMIRAVL